MPKVEVPQKNLVFEAYPKENLMDALIRAGLPVASSCLGEGICSKCVVEINPIDATTRYGERSEIEIRTMTRNKIEISDQSNHRLSCQVFVDSDVQVKTKYW